MINILMVNQFENISQQIGSNYVYEWKSDSKSCQSQWLPAKNCKLMAFNLKCSCSTKDHLYPYDEFDERRTRHFWVIRDFLHSSILRSRCRSSRFIQMALKSVQMSTKCSNAQQGKSMNLNFPQKIDCNTSCYQEVSQFFGGKFKFMDFPLLCSI